MHRLVLHNLGPVKDCDINVNDFMVFTGPQASGKSTIAKAVFFFRTVKDEILDCLVKKSKMEITGDWKNHLKNSLIIKFYRLFISTPNFTGDFEATYYYGDSVYISVCVSPEYENSDRLLDYVNIYFSDKILEHISLLDSHHAADAKYKVIQTQEAQRMSQLFSDQYTTVFIPAGRSLISCMPDLFKDLFDNMNRRQSLNTDYSVQRFVDFIHRLRQYLSDGISGMLSDAKLLGNEINLPRVEKAEKIIEIILKGKYWCRQGLDGLTISSEKQIPLKQASSGQQEAVWVSNIVFYYLTENTRVFLIVEEPESNLYPDTQKELTELLSLFHNAGNQVLITTHSPYVLGTLNNLIYASDIAARGVEGVEKIIDSDCWLKKDKISAWHVENGIPNNATEGELGLIQSDVIEGASIKMMDDCDALYDLSAREE